ncbi:hypothetical protein COLO4_13206 [Corchorus olitorius]|uniref:Uncharacterized protein n=1 Tax=Corchorus olitorius TaxID=93759 RepID=A0A1R3JXK4_9ROSI|nr:hypothetical protein COLO4_13206 [Corchorus olitorius]
MNELEACTQQEEQEDAELADGELAQIIGWGDIFMSSVHVEPSLPLCLSAACMLICAVLLLLWHVSLGLLLK